jgi:hypothetical protein
MNAVLLLCAFVIAETLTRLAIQAAYYEGYDDGFYAGQFAMSVEFGYANANDNTDLID